MRMLLKTGLLVFVAAFVLAGAVSAEGQVSGTLVGDHGGAHVAWDLTLPAATDVTITLNHWPCDTGRAVSFDVWGAADHLAMSDAIDGCTESATFDTGDGGPARLVMHNYLHGVGTWYAVSADGMDLPGAAPVAVAAPAAAAPVAEAETVAPAAAPVAVAVAAAPAPVTAAPVAAEPVSPAPAPAAPGTLAENASLVGDGGGAFATYTLNAEAGKTYTVDLVYGTAEGGMWPGVGFKVWGSDGLLAAGAKPTLHTANQKAATFTADATGPLTVQVYNYHHGLVLFYSLTAEESSAAD